MNHRYSVFILSLMLAVGTRSQEVPLLSYQWKGGHSPYKQIGVVITPAGEATVSWQKYQPPLLEYRTTLSAEEIESVEALIRSTDFFSQTGENPVDLRDAGEI